MYFIDSYNNDVLFSMLLRKLNVDKIQTLKLNYLKDIEGYFKINFET